MAQSTAAVNGKNRLVVSKKKAKEKTPVSIIIPAPDIRLMQLKIVGDSQLIVNKFPVKITKQLEEKKEGKASGHRPKENRNPVEEYLMSLHFINPSDEDNIFSKKIAPHKIEPGQIYPGLKDGQFGFPAKGIKKSSLDACRHLDITKTWTRGAYFVIGNLVQIRGSVPKMARDPVRIGRNIPSVTYRGIFDPWWMTLTIRYNYGVITPEQIVNIFNHAGFCSGLGEDRPSSPNNPGSNGMFHVEGGIADA